MFRPVPRAAATGATVADGGACWDAGADDPRGQRLLRDLHAFLADNVPGAPDSPAHRRKQLDAFLHARGWTRTEEALAELAPHLGGQPDALTATAAELLSRCEAWAFACRPVPGALPVGAAVLPLHDALLALQMASRAAVPAVGRAHREAALLHLNEALIAMEALRVVRSGGVLPDLMTAVAATIRVLTGTLATA